MAGKVAFFRLLKEVLLIYFPEIFGRSDGGKFTMTNAE
jgi:hypothetical protein